MPHGILTRCELSISNKNPMTPECLAARVGGWPGLYSPLHGPTFAAPQRREADTALYEPRRWSMRRLLGTLAPVLKWVGAALVLASCALLVYLGAVLLARLAVWAFFP